MQGRQHVCALSGSLVLLLVTLLMACPFATAQTAAAPPGAAEAPDAGWLRAPEASPKRGGVLRWGGLANSTLYDLHQTGTIANMGPQAPMYDLLVQIEALLVTHEDKKHRAKQKVQPDYAAAGQAADRETKKSNSTRRKATAGN